MALTVSHHEIDGYPRETQERHVFKATRKLRCAWSDGPTLRAELMAGQDDGAGNYAYGHVYPYSSPTTARCKSATVEPAKGKISQGASVGMASYADAIVTANYSTPQPSDPQLWPDHSPDTYISESLEQMTEFLTLSHENFRWGSKTGDAITAAQAPGMLIHGLQYRFTIYSVSSVEESTLAFIGTVNENMVYANLLGLEFAAETLLFADLSMVKGADGLWDVTYLFAIRRTGWNKWYNEAADAAKGAFVRMYHKDAADDQPHYVFKKADWFTQPDPP